MQQLLSHLKEIIFSFHFLTFLIFSSAAFASRRVYSTPIAKMSIESIGEGWEALYYAHLFINFLIVLGSYVAIFYYYGILTFLIVFIFSIAVSARMQKRILAKVLAPEQDNPVERLGIYYKVVTVCNIAAMALFTILVYYKYS